MNYKLEHIILDLRQLFDQVNSGKIPSGKISSHFDELTINIEVKK